MAFSKSNRLFSASSKTFLLGATALLLSPLGGHAQQQLPSPTTQTFSNTDPTANSEYPFTATGSGTYGKRDGTSGTEAYRVATDINNAVINTQLNFPGRTFEIGSGSGTTPTTQNRLTFELANLDFGVGSQGGFSDGSRADVFLSINGDAFPATPNLRIQGSGASGPIFAFNAGTSGVYTSTAPTTITVTSTANSVTSVTITLPSSPTAKTAVAVQIVLVTRGSNQLLIDNVALTSGDSSPLPVELTRFNATAQGQSVNVSWATATEKNSDRFEVQRSATGEVFETVGTVGGKGNTSSAHNYAFVDSRPLAGRSYYRLRQVDTNGTTAYSPVVAVQLHTELAVYPNPTTGMVTLPATLGDVRYRLLNTVGKTLLSGQATGNDQLDLTKFAKGTFFLELTGEAGRTTQRLVRE